MPGESTKSVLFLTLIFVSVNVCRVSADSPQANICSNGPNFSNGSAVHRNLTLVLRDLVTGVSKTGFSVSVHGSVHGLVACRADAGPETWKNWTSGAVAGLRRLCGNAPGARIWFGYCFLRWELFEFAGQLDQVRWSTVNSTAFSVISVASFDTAVRVLLNNLMDKALSVSTGSRRFAAGATQDPRSGVSIFGLEQCWDDIDDQYCRVCLSTVFNSLMGLCSGKAGGVTLTGSCLVMYQIYDFLPLPPPSPPYRPPPRSPPMQPPKFPAVDNPNPEASPHRNNINLPATIAPAASIVALVFLVLVIIVVRIRRKRYMHLQNQGSSNSGKYFSSLDNEQDLYGGKSQQIIFTLKMLADATHNFAESCKLGQGGYGSVYKGLLPDGSLIAVKKLSAKAVQGDRDFMNEVRLLSEIKHKNLVRLLGCCVEGKERMLICECMANNSLDKTLFCPQKKKRLDWPLRCNIICGIARGLAYLHEDSRVRIIHRDIKAPNVLLDVKLNPKIADFGLAQFSPRDQTNTTSRVMGTLNYMAPEYLREGKLSPKVDVYSFGILTLEIISGKKNSINSQDGSPSLIEKAWRLYDEGRLLELVDEMIRPKCGREEVLRFIHVALLCSQGDPNLRPPMSLVVIMLSNHSIQLEKPIHPPRTLFRCSSIVGSVDSGIVVSNSHLSSSFVIPVTNSARFQKP